MSGRVIALIPHGAVSHSRQTIDHTDSHTLSLGIFWLTICQITNIGTVTCPVGNMFPFSLADEGKFLIITGAKLT